MSSLHEFPTVMPSPLCAPARRPIEVKARESSAVENEAREAPQGRTPTTPASPAAPPRSSPTREQMMAAFRVMRDQRSTTDEAEVVLDEIVGDDAPGSLIWDANRQSAG